MILPVKVNEFVNNIFTHLRQTNLFWTFRLNTDNFPHNPLRQASQCWTQDFNSSPPSAAYMRLWIRSALVQIMACHLFGAKPLSKPGSAGLLWIEPIGTNFSEILIKIQNFSFIKMHMKMLAAKWRPFFPGGKWVKCPVHSIICLWELRENLWFLWHKKDLCVLYLAISVHYLHCIGLLCDGGSHSGAANKLK